MREVLAVAAGLLTLVCVVPYVRDIRRGTTRPQRISWLTFALMAVTAAAAQIADGAFAGALLGAGAAAGFSVVFLLSIRHGAGGRSPADLVGLALITISLAAWLLTDRPMVALVGVIGAEVVAGSLTVRKAALDPGSETMSTWIVDGLAGCVAILACDPTRPTELLYPMNHVVLNTAVVVAMMAGRRHPTVAGAR